MKQSSHHLEPQVPQDGDLQRSGFPLQAAKFFENQLLSYKEAARYLSISESYLRRLKQQGCIAYVIVGPRGVRFKLSSLNSWVEEREVK